MCVIIYFCIHCIWTIWDCFSCVINLNLSFCALALSYKQSLRRSAPVKIIEAPVRTYIPTSLPPGSVRAGPVAGNAPSIAGSDGRILYDWQESTIPMDAQSYRSMPNQ